MWMNDHRRGRGAFLASVVALLAAWGVGCDRIERPAVPPARPSGPHADGERGHGWFMTLWGPEEVDYSWQGGQRVYEYDLVLEPGSELPEPPEGRAREPLFAADEPRWPMDPATGLVTIPYEIINQGTDAAPISDAVFARTQAKILHAMMHWQTHATRPGDVALLRFVPRDRESRWVEFRVHQVDACNVGGGNPLPVHSDPDCAWESFVHEIGHVLTFRHEHRRADRNDDVNVRYYPDRVIPRWADQFDTTRSGSYVGTTYDARSIMHYSSCQFSRLGHCSGGNRAAWVLENVADLSPTPTHGYISSWWGRPPEALLTSSDVCGLLTLYHVPCTGSGIEDPDAGTPTAPDAGTPIADAGSRDAGPVDAGLPPEGVRFPVTLAAAGMIWSGASGETLCAGASGTDPSIALAPCDETLATHRWALASTSVLRNVGSGRCAVPEATTDGAAVSQLGCRPDDAERWQFGEMELVNGVTGMCIAVPSSEYFSGQRLLYRPCNGAPNQRFSYVPETHALMVRGYCLTAGDGDGVRIELRDCVGGASQQWIETGGGFSAAGLCIGVRGGAMSSSGAVIESATCNGAVGQMWGLRGQIVYDDDTFCLAAAGASLVLASCVAGATEQTLIWWPRSTCDALACADLGASCGTYDDGCGVGLDCGMCPVEGFNGDAGPVPIECIPVECVDLPGACGPTSDECGDMLDCGPCPIPGGGCGCAVSSDREAELRWLAFLVAACVGLRRRRR